MANHYHTRQNAQGSLGLAEIHDFQTGWQVVFHGVRDMPDRIAIPLPLTFTASETMAREWLNKRFPGVEIQRQHA